MHRSQLRRKTALRRPGRELSKDDRISSKPKVETCPPFKTIEHRPDNLRHKGRRGKRPAPDPGWAPQSGGVGQAPAENPVYPRVAAPQERPPVGRVGRWPASPSGRDIEGSGSELAAGALGIHKVHSFRRSSQDGKARNRSQFGWVLLAFIASPFLVILLLLRLGDAPERLFGRRAETKTGPAEKNGTKTENLDKCLDGREAPRLTPT